MQNSIGDFREHLAQLQNMKGLTSEEKGSVSINVDNRHAIIIYYHTVQ